MNNQKPKREFSKTLLIQESALIWVVTIAFLVLAYICIVNGFDASLPWLTAMAGFPWTAYGVSQVWYYKKSEAENTKNGIKFESVMAELNNSFNQYDSPDSNNDDAPMI